MKLLLTILIAVALLACVVEEPAPTPTPDLGDVCVVLGAAIIEGQAREMSPAEIALTMGAELGESPETILMLFDRCYDYYQGGGQ